MDEKKKACFKWTDMEKFLVLSPEELLAIERVNRAENLLRRCYSAYFREGWEDSENAKEVMDAICEYFSVYEKSLE